MSERILYIDPFLPLHDRNSGSLRLYRILQLLQADGHSVTYLPHTIWAGQEKYAMDLAQLGIEVLAPPRGTHDDVSVTNALSGRTFDTVIISFYKFAASYTPFIRTLCPQARIVIDTVDLHFVRERRQAETLNDATLAAKAEQTHTDEIAAYASADALIAISDIEKATLKTELPNADIYVIPNVHELGAEGPGYQSRNGLVFVGNFWHTPNGEGIVWFCNEVWPRVIRRIPTMTLDIIGQDPPSELLRFLNESVRVHGWVQSVTLFLDAARLSIAPLLHGAGLKGKVGEALAAGLPVVTTSIGAEGMGLRNGEDAMVADSAEAFADAIVTAHQSADLWDRLAHNGREVIRQTLTSAHVKLAVRALIPQSPHAPVVCFGVPDWSDTNSLEAVLRSYIELHQNTTNSSLHLGVFDYDVNDAFAQLSEVVLRLGYNPESIPDVTVSPLPSLDLSFLNSDTVWVPMRHDLEKPAHVTQTFGAAVKS